MFGQAAARRRQATPAEGLFERIGTFLDAQGLSPDPANYAVAHRLLSRDDAETRAVVQRLGMDGVRLSRGELEALGGPVVAGRAVEPDPACADEDMVDRLVVQTREQADAVAGMMRAMHDEARGFGRDLAQSAAAIEETSPSSLEVVRLTRSMIARAADAEARLADAADETDTLRAELAEAQACARRDPLTGLGNRRAFDEAFAALDPAGGAALALVDLDRFKQVNDGFGHEVGDRVLRAVATVLADACEDHLVARHGGEEFAVLAAATGRDSAARLINSAREAVGKRRFRARDTGAAIGRVSFSAGVVAVRAGESAADALHRADHLLYQAKAAGRDRVVIG